MFFLLSIQIAYSQEVKGKLYSYLCLSASNSELCLGISPGEKAIETTLAIQLKPRIRNELKGLDRFKTRYDITYGFNGTIRSSSASEYCIQNPRDSEIVLKRNGGCAYFNTSSLILSEENREQEGVIVHRKTQKCLTVMRCDMIRNTNLQISYCDKHIMTPERSMTFRATSLIRLYPCWYSKNGNRVDKRAQTFRNRLDCATGCTINMQGDGVCDQPCANDVCELDGGDCISASPTPPTQFPSTSPSQSPTANPTDSPTTRSPSQSPTELPTVSPSQTPTSSPSLRPTTSVPSSIPTTSPSITPTESPTETNTTELVTAISSGDDNWWIWLIIALLCFLFLLCCVGIVYRRREKKQKEKSKEEVKTTETYVNIIPEY